MASTTAHPPVPTVLVTGGGVRLGAEICRAFAAHGWHVLCHHRRSAQAAWALCQELTAAGARATPIEGDLTTDAGRQALMEQAGRWGPVTCLVNNASAFEPDTGERFDPALARQQLEVNLVAPLALSSLLVQALPEDTTEVDASVIHILDQKVYNLNPDYFSYTITKLALERAVVLQAQSLAPKVRVCGVAPGLMYLSGPQTAENFERASRINPMRRPIEPRHVAQTVRFLAEMPAITGSTVCVDNGQHLLPLARDVMFAVEQAPEGGLA